MKKTLLITLLLGLLLPACTIRIGNPGTIRGSGVVASETRTVSGFTSIELAGSADVDVRFGETEAVVVEAEDNLLPLIETEVRGSKLIINLKPNTSINPTKPIRVDVTMKSLQGASLPGSGNITIAGLNADSVRFDLPGSGAITADGVVETLNATLAGSGRISCGKLQARSARVELSGSGGVTVFASQDLNVTLNGSGSVTYLGEPAEVRKSITGSGSVEAGR